jgi:hypothetical protein
VGLVELVISAALLVVIAIGTLTAFDAAGRLTTDEQRHSEANTLAQQDEDRLRAIPVSQLSGLNQTQYMTANGAPLASCNVNTGTSCFTVTSTGQFQTESTGSSSCSSNGSADFIRTTSTVTWPNIGTRLPVTAESVITPPAGGSLIVDVVDSQGNGVPNMTVAGSGPSTLSATTGSNGCAIFAGLTGGNYNISVAQGGYVDKDGNSFPPPNQQTATVIEGSSVTKVFQFDKAGSIQATFTSGQGGAATCGDTITIANSNMTYPGVRSFGTAGACASSVTAGNVFPFQSGYTVYAGSCQADEPSANGGTDPLPVVVPPGAGAPSATIPLPVLNVTVAASLGVVSATLVITDTGCNVKRTLVINPNGVVGVALPYGTYTVCASDTVLGQTTHVQQANILNNSIVTPTAVSLNLGSTSAGPGSCP